jgi:hypothetical protein
LRYNNSFNARIIASEIDENQDREGEFMSRNSENSHPHNGSLDTPADETIRGPTPFEAFIEEYKKGNEENAARENKRFFWERLSGVGIAIYVLLTLGILVVGFRQMNISQDTAKQQLRAYVLYDNGTVTWEGTTFKANVVFKNAGQTPAHGVTSFVKIDIFPPLGEPVTDPTRTFHFEETSAGSSDMGPAGTLQLQSTRDPNSANEVSDITLSSEKKRFTFGAPSNIEMSFMRKVRAVTAPLLSLKRTPSLPVHSK